MNETTDLFFATDTLYASIAESNAGERATATNVVPVLCTTLTVSPLRVASADSVELFVTATTPPAPVVKSATSRPSEAARASLPASDWS